MVASKDAPKNAQNTDAASATNPIGTISNIFGGAELLES
jgi:hypothetical protein